ncbi:MAG: hypothetical protein CMM61_13555 [Rhodospirillaceae bacterium]|nr:hypothetical protein [Rhodospirillaceae bacterium]
MGLEMDKIELSRRLKDFRQRLSAHQGGGSHVIDARTSKPRQPVGDIYTDGDKLIADVLAHLKSAAETS